MGDCPESKNITYLYTAEPRPRTVINVELLLFTAGLPVGIATSIAAWWILWRGLGPKGRFSPVISASKDVARPEEARYRIKFRSTGPRAMMDVHFSAIIFIPDLEADGGQALIDIPLFDDRVPRLGGRRGRRKRKNRGVLDTPHRIVTLRLAKIDRWQYERLPSEFSSPLSKSAPGSLEQVFQKYPGSLLQVTCTASDSWTGARRFFLSPPYNLNSIARGVFRRGATFELQATPEDDPPVPISYGIDRGHKGNHDVGFSR